MATDAAANGLGPIYYSMRGGAEKQDPVAIVELTDPGAASTPTNDTSAKDLTITGNAAFAAQAAIKTVDASPGADSPSRATEDVKTDTTETLAQKSDTRVDTSESLATIGNALHKSGDKDLGEAGETSFVVENSFES